MTMKPAAELQSAFLCVQVAHSFPHDGVHDAYCSHPSNAHVSSNNSTPGTAVQARESMQV